MTDAFQPDAYQPDAFQLDSQTTPPQEPEAPNQPQHYHRMVIINGRTNLPRSSRFKKIVDPEKIKVRYE
jgi:hypothetical protein